MLRAFGLFQNGDRVIAILACLLCLPGAALAKTSGLEQSGIDVAIALPVIAAGISTYKGDWDGDVQLGADVAATVGTSLLLKTVVKERRPDGSDMKSFPSDTASLGFSAANYLWDRYGWEYGAPAYAAAAFVGYTRVEAKQHHPLDVLASAAIALGYSKLFVTRYSPALDLQTRITAVPGGAFLGAEYHW